MPRRTQAPASLHAELTYDVPASVAPYVSTPSVLHSAIPASVVPYLSTPSMSTPLSRLNAAAVPVDWSCGLVLDRGAVVQFRAAPASLGTDSVVLIEIERHMWPSTSEEIKKTRGEHAEASCAICLEDMHAASCVRLSCGHCMHTACAQASERHGLVDRGIFRCPECRGAVSFLRAVFCAHSIELLRISAVASSSAQPQDPADSAAVSRGDMTDAQWDMLRAEIRREQLLLPPTFQQSSQVAGTTGEHEQRLQHGLQHQEQHVQLLPGHVASLDPQEPNVVMLDAADLEHHLAAMSGIDSSVSVVISTSPGLPRDVEGNQTLGGADGRADAEHHGLRGQVRQLFPSGNPGLAPSRPGVAGAPPPPGTRADVRQEMAGLQEAPLMQDAPTLIQDPNVVMSMSGIDHSSSSAPGGVLQAGGLQDAHTQQQWREMYDAHYLQESQQVGQAALLPALDSAAHVPSEQQPAAVSLNGNLNGLVQARWHLLFIVIITKLYYY